MLGAYGLGRIATPTAVGLVVASEVERRAISRQLAALGAE